MAKKTSSVPSSKWLFTLPSQKIRSFFLPFERFWITLLDLPRLPKRGRFTVVEWCSLLITSCRAFASNIQRAGSRGTCGALTLRSRPLIELWPGSSGSRMERFSINWRVVCLMIPSEWCDDLMHRSREDGNYKKKLINVSFCIRPMPSFTKPFTVKCH